MRSTTAPHRAPSRRSSPRGRPIALHCTPGRRVEPRASPVCSNLPRSSSGPRLRVDTWRPLPALCRKTAAWGQGRRTDCAPSQPHQGAAMQFRPATHIVVTACFALAAATATVAFTPTAAMAAVPGCAAVEVQNVRPQQGKLKLAAYLDAASFGKRAATSIDSHCAIQCGCQLRPPVRCAGAVSAQWTRRRRAWPAQALRHVRSPPRLHAATCGQGSHSARA